MDQVLPGNACSGLLFAPGSAVLLTHEKPPQVALPSRKAESPERPSRKVESPERPAAHDAACDALNKRRRLRGKRPAQNVRQFLPAPGSGLLPPGAPRLPCSTRSGPITTGRRSMIGNWADLAASTQSTNTTSS